MTRFAAITGILFLAAAPAVAQVGGSFDLSWSTVDGGGGTSSGGSFTLTGTVGQHDAGAAGGGAFTCLSGFWAVAGGAPCYANCDGSTGTPLLNVNDFVCFQARFAAADPYADCDQSGGLNVNDFVCFQGRFAAGCP